MIALDRLNLDDLCFQRVASFAPEEMSDAVNAIAMLKGAIPEASRALELATTVLRDQQESSD